MRFPTALFTAVAGLWQHPLVSEEETITNTRHVHVTRFVTNLSSTAYAVRMGTLTLYMEYLPATLTKKSAPWQALQTPHLELRAERISTTHIKVTQTVAETQATIFTSKVRTSVSTITNVPQSLIEEAAEDAAELRPSQVTTAASSVNDDVLTHSTVALLANTGLSPVVESSALPSPTQSGPVQSSNSSASSALTQPTAAIPSSPLPIDLELRSNAETTTNGQLQATTTEIPSTVVVVIFGSSTSTMTPIPPTMPTSTTSSQASSTAVSSTSRQITVSEQSTRTTQSTLAPVAVNTNAAQIKSIQTALIQAPTYSDITVTTSSSASSSPTVQECSGTCSSLASISTAVSSSSPSSASSNKVYTIPVTMTDVTSSAASTVLPSAAQTSDSATIVTSYGAQSSASSAAADIAADNAAGASGGDSSFKLSKGGFAAIISVVSIGVGLGIIFLVLFVIARRRQWKVRQSIARASRRITGRFSSHPNKTALRSEKEPTLPIIEPRQPLGPRPAPSSRRHQGFANIDATLHSNYRGVETVGRSVSRGPEAWRRAMAVERLEQSQKKKPELRVDTGAAARLEEGRRGQQTQKKKGDWKDLFRAL